LIRMVKWINISNVCWYWRNWDVYFAV
jgi:hypothetical protein